VLEQKVLTVKEVTQYIRNLLEEDVRLANVWVKGEISNYKHHSSGHIYFTLKDSWACLKCVMFKSRASGLLFQPENGMEVIAGGYISVYDRMGQYQLYVQAMEPSGVGSLHMAYEQLKKKLASEGLFDAERKKPLPALPSTIAVITSPTGAAIRDVLNIINRRFPGIKILVIPTLVQGEGAPKAVARALELVNRHAQAELVLLVRGGGSLEELWAFNTEVVARAIARSKIPVLTGIGHETDFTIADFVADRRAPTPSAAAELAVPIKDELLVHLGRVKKTLLSSIGRCLKDKKKRVDELSSSRVFVRPEVLLSSYWQCVDSHEQRLKNNIYAVIGNAKQRFLALSGKLDTLSPVKILARGYAICRKDAAIIRDSRDVEIGDDVEVILRKGSLICRVFKKRGELAWRRK